MSKKSILAIVAILGVAVLAGVLTLGGRQTDPGPAAAPVVVAVGEDSLDVGPIPDETRAFLEQGRMWRVARSLREHLADTPDAPPGTVLLAARAEGEWGGWSATREYLEGEDWLDDVASGEGWYWLARAREEDGDHREAVEAYDRFLAARGSAVDAKTATAELRRGLLLLRLGDRAGGLAGLESVRGHAPFVEDWVSVLSAEAAAESGDTASVREMLGGLPASMRHRGRKALLRGYEVAGDRAGAIRLAIGLRASGGTQSERADLSATAGRLAREGQDLEMARRELLAAMNTAPASTAAREAAGTLLEMPNLTPTERLAIAETYVRHGNAARAAEGFRAVLDAGGLSASREQQIRLSYGQALFDASDYTGAEAALRPLESAPAATARASLLLIGRAQYQRSARSQAFATFDRLATRFPGSAEGAEGLFLIADLSHDAGSTSDATTNYRRIVSNFPGTDRAGLSLMRLAGMRYLAKDFPAAGGLWEEYRSAYPAGERWLEATYWAGRSLEAAGDTTRAYPLYRAAMSRDPLSYYALRSSERLGVPFWPIAMGPPPPDDAAAQAQVDDWMRGVDLLREAGLFTEADAETQRLTELAGDDRAVVYALAEALSERGYALRGIRLGQQLQQSEPLNERMLRLLYPLPYRDLVEQEAMEQGLDPFMVAAMIRQESLFTARISSPVGARGLMQIMPETGSALARGVGIDGWDDELLFQPEINVHLGTIYLAEQMGTYDSVLPAVFSAYNAGPHRIDVWRRFPEYGDNDLFTERIPYRETREYVKILTRNTALYEGLYGSGE